MDGPRLYGAQIVVYESEIVVYGSQESGTGYRVQSTHMVRLRPGCGTLWLSMCQHSSSHAQGLLPLSVAQVLRQERPLLPAEGDV